jgi:glycosyltransferase involved in cell wall biosynthesis
MDLRNVIEKLIRNPAMVEERKSRAREYVLKNYSWDRVVDEMEELYGSIRRLRRFAQI